MTTKKSSLISLWFDRERVVALPRPDSGKRGNWLAAFIDGDVQSACEVRELLDWIVEVETGKVERKEGDGNAFNIILRPDGAELEHLILVEEPNVHYTLQEIRDALEDKLAAIGERRKLYPG